MKLVDLAVRRPVTVTMLLLGTVFLGLLSWRQLPQDLFPAISLPQLTVVTRYPNAAPEEMETLVTRPIEEAVLTTRNLKSLRSISREGLSLVTATFNWGTAPDFAALEMREKLDLIQEDLPRDCADPVVKKINPFASPLMILSLSSKNGDPVELREIAEKQVKEPLQKVSGVASVVLSGGLKKEIFVEVDSDRLRRRGLDLMKLIRAVKDANVNYPAGSAKESFYEVVVRTLGEFKSARDISGVVIDAPEENRGEGKVAQYQVAPIVYLRDLAEVREGTQERQSLSRHNGCENISCAVYPQAASNPVQTARQVRRAVEELRPFLPKEARLELVYDKARFIEESISATRRSAVAGGLLAFGVLLFFLAQVPSALIVSLAIPVSIAATFLLMFLKGISVNMISLGGVALGVGMLVDNAIVIVENINRHRALGSTWMEASLTGTREVALPVVASTLTNIAVFLPILFLSGLEAQLFRDLAFTVIFSQLASLAVALILIPRWAAHQKGEGGGDLPFLKAWSAAQITRLQTLYSRLLEAALRQPRKIMTAVALAFGVSLLLLFLLPKELLPKVDQGEFSLLLTMPNGTSLESTDAAARKIESLILKEPVAQSMALSVGSESDAESEALRILGSHQARFVVTCRKPRREPTAAVVARLERAARALDLGPAQLEFQLQDSPLGGTLLSEEGVVVEVRGQDLNQMRQAVEHLKTAIAALAPSAQIRDSLPLPSPEFRIEIDKNRSALYQLSSKEIALATQAAVKGVVATEMREGGSEIDVRVRLDPRRRGDLASLSGLTIFSPADEEIPLEELASLRAGEGPSEIERLDGARVYFLTCRVMKGSLSRLEEKIAQLLRKEKLTDGIEAALSGAAKEKRHSYQSLIWALLLSIMVIYMILAAQFESLQEPFLILFTVPFSLIGVALALFLTQTPLSVMVFLGLVLLGGIVVNNGIVLIQCIHDLRREGKKTLDAVLNAGAARLRPILMTMLTSVLGLLPFLWDRSPEGGLQTSLALTLMGGLSLSTLLTLILLPVFYLELEKKRKAQEFKTIAGACS